MLEISVGDQTIPRDKLLEMYRSAVSIRQFEERSREMYQAGQLPRHGHLYAGQEAIAVGAIAALNEDDYISTTHRGHGPTLARTHDMNGIMAEMCGKEAGFCNGKGGTMHAVDFDKGMLGAFPIVGAATTMAVGGGLAAKTLGNGRVSVAFFGDGASNQGTFHEGINLSAIWDLPVIFICENNQYAIFTPVRYSTRVENIADRAVAYGIPGVVVDGNDALAVYAAVSEAADRARAGKGPTLIEAKTYRWGGHHTGDPGTTYRSREETEEWKRKDPVPRLRSHLLETGAATEADLANIEEGISRQLEEAISFALAAPDPAPEETYSHIYAPEYKPEVT